MLELITSERAAPGLAWLQGTPLHELAALTARKATPAESPTGSQGPAGYEKWFCDFNLPAEFTLGPPALYGQVNDATLAAEAIPTVTATTNATPPNLNHLYYWWRGTDIGTPTTIHFWTDRSLGTDNELHSSIKLGCANSGHGVTIYYPHFNLGTSTGTNRKHFGWVARVRKQSGSIPTGAGFFGFSAQLLTPGSVLSTAGALAAGANDLYFGFQVSTASELIFVINQKNSAQFSIATGITLSTTMQYLELRGFLDNGGGSSWQTGSYIDAYVDGQLVRRAGRAHTVEPTDITWDPGSEPLSPCMAVVKTAGGATTPLLQCDLMGAFTNRLVHLTTAPQG